MTCKCTGGSAATDRVDFQYAVKVVCGPVTNDHGSLPRGDYKTKVNIHNFSRCDCVTFRWKVSVGLPHAKVGPISDFFDATLCADEALEIDSSDVLKVLADQAKGHVEGWVVIESPAELDVVAVYGTAPSADGSVTAFHTERVPARCIPVCDNFELDPSTGVSRWDVAGPYPGLAPANATFSQAVLGSVDGNWPAMPGALWIHPPGPAVQPEGFYTYRLKFNLCFGFRTPRLEGHFFADYSAVAYLNGHQISIPSAGPNFPTAIALQATSYFKAGENELVILVKNSEKSTTGMALRGDIEVANGLCAGEPMPLLSCPGISYRLYTRHFWWQLGIWHDGEDWWGGWVSNGAEAGTTGQHRRAEALQMMLSNAPPGTDLQYRVWYHTATGVHQSPAGGGWASASAGDVAGTTTDKHPIVSVEVRLVNAPLHCHVRYKIHRRKGLFDGGTGGWSNDWVYDGAEAGAHNYLPYYRVEAMVAEIVYL
jgi:hypothetical protein